MNVFDRLLDGIVSGGRAQPQPSSRAEAAAGAEGSLVRGGDELDDMRRAANWLHRNTSQPTPDRAFTNKLHASHLADRPVAAGSVGSTTSRSGHVATSGSRVCRGWLVAEAAALLLLLISAIWILTHPSDGYGQFRPPGDVAGFGIGAAHRQDQAETNTLGTPAASPTSPAVKSNPHVLVVAPNGPVVLDALVARVGGRETPIFEIAAAGAAVVGTAEAGANYEIAGELVEVERHVWVPVWLHVTDAIGWIDAGLPGSRPYLMTVSIELRFDGYLRSAPGRDENEIRRVSAGAAFKPFGESVTADGVTWIPVLDQTTGQIGWLGAVSGSPLTWRTGTAVTVAVDALILRAGPSAEFDVVMALDQGTVLAIVEGPIETGGEVWLKVAVPRGTIGYILASSVGPPY